MKSLDAREYEFYSLIRKLERSAVGTVSAGGDGPFREEAVFFSANPGMAFHVADVERVIENGGDREGFPPYEVVQNVISLLGSSSPLPAFYTEEVLASDDEENPAKIYLDLFVHRLVSYLYRIRKKYVYFMQYEAGATDEMSQRIFALFGMQGRELKNDKVNWQRLLPYAGMLAMKRCSGSMLAGIISHYFGDVNVAIKEYVPEQSKIDQGQWNNLGVSNNSLGQNCLLGNHILDPAGRFNIHIGPVHYSVYQRFMPGQEDYVAIREIISFVMVDKIRFGLTIIVDSGTIGCVQLGLSGGLGQNAWLGDPGKGALYISQRM